MAPVPAPAALALACNPSRPPLEIPEQFTLTVLDGPTRYPLSGRAVKLVGRRLIARLAEPLRPGACIRIDCDDAFLLGEILGCWREGNATFAAVEVQQALSGLAELAARNDCRNETPLSPVLPLIRRQSS